MGGIREGKAGLKGFPYYLLLRKKGLILPKGRPKGGGLIWRKGLKGPGRKLLLGKLEDYSSLNNFYLSNYPLIFWKFLILELY